MQPDLSSRRPSIRVHLFPLHRRTDMVQRVAAALQSKSYDSGQRYWSQHVQAERAKLKRAGLSAADVDAEISRYATAISRILHSREQNSATSDGAA